MIEVAFHFNASDRLGYACRLLRKAVGRGVRVIVTAPDEVLARLDVLLWTFSDVDFIPHARHDAAPALREASAVLLTPRLDDLPHRQVLVNLGPQVPAGFDQFERVIEVVSQEEADRQQARVRWKAYAAAGHTLVRHDLAEKEVH